MANAIGVRSREKEEGEGDGDRTPTEAGYLWRHGWRERARVGWRPNATASGPARRLAETLEPITTRMGDLPRDADRGIYDRVVCLFE